MVRLILYMKGPRARQMINELQMTPTSRAPFWWLPSQSGRARARASESSRTLCHHHHHHPQWALVTRSLLTSAAVAHLHAEYANDTLARPPGRAAALFLHLAAPICIWHRYKRLSQRNVARSPAHYSCISDRPLYVYMRGAISIQRNAARARASFFVRWRSAIWAKTQRGFMSKRDLRNRTSQAPVQHEYSQITVACFYFALKLPILSSG